MFTVSDISFFHVVLFLALTWSVHIMRGQLRRSRYDTPLRGPLRNNFIFGHSKEILDTLEPGVLYERWEKEYGSAYRIPSLFGRYRVILCDPRAIAHFFSRETYGYVQIPAVKKFIEDLVCIYSVWSQSYPLTLVNRLAVAYYGLTGTITNGWWFRIFAQLIDTSSLILTGREKLLRLLSAMELFAH